MKKAEIVNTYLLNKPDIVIPMRRGDFYKEQVHVFKKTGKPSRAVEVVSIFIFNSRKELLVQKRSSNKQHNPNLLDKSIGGHLHYGDTPDYTVMVETIQELQTPSIVLKDESDFQKTFHLLSSYLETIAIIKYEFLGPIFLERIIDNEKIMIANKVHLYCGVYDGRIRPVDREAKGVLFYSLPDLKKEMRQFPDAFTADLHVLLKKRGVQIQKFAAHINKK